jgi:NAD-dependent SIR2 family protein deacetylase
MVQPSFTHMALVALMKKGLLHYIVTQNVDNLHLRSGVPRERHSELHGNIFAEHCDRCNTEYIRTFDGQADRSTIMHAASVDHVARDLQERRSDMPLTRF